MQYKCGFVIKLPEQYFTGMPSAQGISLSPCFEQAKQSHKLLKAAKHNPMLHIQTA